MQGLPPPITPITMPAQVRPVTSMATTMQRLPTGMAAVPGQAVVINRPAAGVLQRSPMILQPGQQTPGMMRIAGPGQPAAAAPSLAPRLAGRNIIINQPGMGPMSVPLQTLQGLRPGQGLPTNQPGHLLVKTENGQYQILKVGSMQAAGSSSTTSTMQTRPPVQICTPMQQVINTPSVTLAATPVVAPSSNIHINPAHIKNASLERELEAKRAELKRLQLQKLQMEIDKTAEEIARKEVGLKLP